MILRQAWRLRAGDLVELTTPHSDSLYVEDIYRVLRNSYPHVMAATISVEDGQPPRVLLQVGLLSGAAIHDLILDPDDLVRVLPYPLQPLTKP